MRNRSSPAVTLEELAHQNGALRAAYCEDIEKYNQHREEEASGAFRLATRERPARVQVELGLERGQS
jgi:hypothetical protein